MKEVRLLNNELYNFDNKCLVMVTFGSGLKRQVASGSLIKANGMVFIATAAHCIYNTYEKYYFDNITFSLLSENYKKKYKISKAFIHKKWIDEAALECDTAFVLLDEKTFDNKKYIDYAVEPGFNLEYGLEYGIKGFNAKLFFGRPKPVTVMGKAIRHDKYTRIIQGIICKRKNGISGGPWLTVYNNKIVQNSVSSFSFKNNDDILWGPFWGNTIENVLHIACGVHNGSSDVIIKEY